jgi:hypothetical protein
VKPTSWRIETGILSLDEQRIMKLVAWKQYCLVNPATLFPISNNCAPAMKLARSLLFQ